MSATINVNGRIAHDRDAVIPVLDHGFLFGEGIYETMRTYGRRPFLFDRHMQRLRRSASLIALDVPFSDADLADRIQATMAAAGLGASEAYVRVLVTRGIGDLTYDLAATPVPSLVVIVKPHVDLPPAAYTRGVPVAIVGILRNHPGSVNPVVKCNNLMNSALAMQEANRAGAFEGVMRNYRGELAECSTANLFVVRSGTVLTPPADAGILIGVTRGFVIELAAALSIPCEERVLRDDDLLTADEAFLTSSTREIVPIATVNGRPLPETTAGSVTAALLAAYRRRAASAP